MFIKTTLKDGRVSYTKPRGFHMSEAELLSVCRNAEEHYFKGAKTEIVSRIPYGEKPLETYFEDCDLERFGNRKDVARIQKELRKLEKLAEKEKKKVQKNSKIKAAAKKPAKTAAAKKTAAKKSAKRSKRNCPRRAARAVNAE